MTCVSDMQAVDLQLLLLLPLLMERSLPRNRLLSLFQKLNCVPARDPESWISIFSQCGFFGFYELKFSTLKVRGCGTKDINLKINRTRN